jgi:hypothetical protein
MGVPPDRLPAEIPPVTTSFAEGRYFDLWMLVHFASGAAGGYSNVFWELPVPLVYGLALILMILWELGEYIARIYESWPNRVIDIVVGLLGVALAVGTAPFLLPSREILAFAVGTGAGLLGLGLGVRARQRRQRATAASAGAGKGGARAP